MKVRYPYLKDSAFLYLMDTNRLKEQFVKITVLDWFERPIKDIQGIVTGGNINIDGNSNVRRTCNLSAFIGKKEYGRVTETDNLFSINKKVYLQIGYKNVTDQYIDFPIIWYPMGVYVMINPSLSHSLSGTILSVQLRDKMVLLNGEVGGVIPASTEFDKYDTIDENGQWITIYPTINQIIREAVNHFGGEQLGKIIISDVDTRVKKVMKWIGTNPVYLVNDDGQYTLRTSKPSGGDVGVTEYEYGRDVGYIYVDFIYPEELIANAGDNVCTILDKIKNLLGNYEYFYDIDGNFRFQEKKNYLNTSHAKVEIDKLTKDDYLVDMSKGKTVYSFTDKATLISAYSNSPQYNKIKNDFVVWGLRENANGNSIPIRYHLAIDTKPRIGNTYKGFFYEDPDDGLTKVKVPIKYENYAKLSANQGAEGVFYMDAETGIIYKWNGEDYEPIEVDLQDITTKDWRTELYLQGADAEPLGIESNYYYTELLDEWPKMYDVKAGEYYQEFLDTPSDLDFYLDIIDSQAAIAKFSVQNIGRRTYVVNDDSVNCIFEPEIPDYVLIETGQPDTDDRRKECEDRNQKYIQVESSIYKLLVGGGTANSAYQVVRQLLHEYTSYNESISIQAIPLFHLEPNTRVEVRDIESNIFGDYMMSSISIPLDVNGTMSISATRALEKI